MDTIGKRVRFARERKGWTLSQAAKEGQLSRSFLWGIENQENHISAVKLVQLAKALDVPVQFLATGEDAPGEYRPADLYAITIPQELAEVAEEGGLSFKQTTALLRIWQVTQRVMTKEAWQILASFDISNS